MNRDEVARPKIALKVPWEDFRMAALERLAEKHPAISLNRDDNTRMVRTQSYEGEIDCFETPEFVYIELEPNR